MLLDAEKQDWGMLVRKMDLKLENIPVVIYTCFVLHNFCEKNKTYINEDIVIYQMNEIKANENKFKNIPDPVYSVDEGQGPRHDF